MLTPIVDHLIHNVLPAAADYAAAEQELSTAHRADATPASWETAARTAKRRAAELAIAIDGLTDRAEAPLGLSKPDIRNAISALCYWPGTTNLRAGAHDRIRGVANAYKHQNLRDATLPITSDADVLVVGAGFGVDGWGVGKYGGVEVLVRERGGDVRKFLGDAPTAVSAWFRFLAGHGPRFPSGRSPSAACRCILRRLSNLVGNQPLAAIEAGSLKSLKIALTVVVWPRAREAASTPSRSL